jgi:hypothetical protein
MTIRDEDFDTWVAHPEAGEGERNEENHHDGNKVSVAFYPAIIGLFILFLKKRKLFQ